MPCGGAAVAPSANINRCVPRRRGGSSPRDARHDQKKKLPGRNGRTPRAKPPHPAPTTDTRNPPDSTHTPLGPTKCQPTPAARSEGRLTHPSLPAQARHDHESRRTHTERVERLDRGETSFWLFKQQTNHTHARRENTSTPHTREIRRPRAYDGRRCRQGAQRHVAREKRQPRKSLSSALGRRYGRMK